MDNNYDKIKEPIEMLNAEEAYVKKGGTIKEFCMNDAKFKEEYEKSKNEKDYETLIDDFIDFIYENAGNPVLQTYFAKTSEDKAVSMMDMEDVLNLFIVYANNDREQLDKIEKGLMALKIYKARKKQEELMKYPAYVKDVDLTEYCFVYLSDELIKEKNISPGLIFSISEGMLYNLKKEPIYVKGEISLVYIGRENNTAVTYDFFNKMLNGQM